MTKKDLEKALGYYPKYKLTFVSVSNPKIRKIVACWDWYPEAYKGDIYAQLTKNGFPQKIEDPDFYLYDVKQINA